jgi:hypothetical protein
MSYIYVKDQDGYVIKKLASELLANEVVITKEEFEALSGDEYYNKTFGRGGKRAGAGRKPTNGILLKFQIRVSEKEKEFIRFARAHNLNYDELMQGNL